MTAEFLTDAFTKTNRAAIISDGGLDSCETKLISITHDSENHVVILFEDGNDEITDRTITFTLPE